ncbi:radical SAM protein [Epibacterium sp. SM1979]|uniref:Radical SAM protein n=1 Tax=Tritonibacter litoralis TaxID=2662264 RepID=A0A843YC62_9RHOB|nr:radical SAM protein [Tritonibacter litoralis]MQQ07064.1 radical SAM protein [Tritonibacter litoralis]
MKDLSTPVANVGKFQDRLVTAKGAARAKVSLTDPDSLWFNTGTLCNIECENCYILSSPKNDALVYLTVDDIRSYLDQIEARKWPVKEIGFTGGEPFMNPQMVDMTRACLERGFEVLILTNAMRPMMRKRVQDGLLELGREFGDKLNFRISLDHHSSKLHDQVRGKGSFDLSIAGMTWLRDNGFKMAVAGRALWEESDAEARAGFAALFAEHGFDIDPNNPAETVLFPEMDVNVEVPEISSECWGILNKSPDAIMCSSSRMVVKRKGAKAPTVLACTLLPYEDEFELGETLEEAEQDVYLNHPHCAKFCVLGGASCSG